ncbi:MAG: glycosyltransferase family 2 protein [Deltaproteobacteria bacterium]|nr:glycosyltransferase family 2 protein [Deltaproteobacteria bacterium]
MSSPEPNPARSTATKPVSVSVVIPAFNEEARLPVTLTKVLKYLEETHPDHEVLVVDDGSRDHTADVAESFRDKDPALRVLRLERNRGKGAAVRTGVLASTKDWVLVTDADLSTPIEELAALLRWAALGYEVVIGSRGLPQSDIRLRQPRYRELMGRGFNLLVRSLLLGGFSDTQCGFKLYRGDVGRDLFGRSELDGFAYDVEILLMAKQKHRVREVPVVWYHAGNSKVSPGRDAAKMALDLVKMRIARRHRG